MLTVVDALVLRPAREAHVDGVYAVRRFDTRTQKPLPVLSLPDFRLLESRPPSGVTALAAVGLEYVTLQTPEGAERIWTGLVTGHWAEVFHLQAQAGRLIHPADDHPGAASVAVVSARIWREYYGGRSEMLGRATLEIDGRAFLVIGVARRGFRGPAVAPCDVWIARGRWEAVLPAASNASERFSRNLAGCTYARLASGASAHAVGAALRTALTSVARIEPTVRFTVTRATAGTLEARQYGVLAGAMAALVLLAACANVTSLFHVRTVVAGRELAVKRALGAQPSALFIPLFAEAMTIAAMAGVVGAGLASVIHPLRTAIRSVGNVAVFDAAPIADSILAWNAGFGAAAALLGLLAAVALTIALFGVYGLVSCVTSARLREFGIRLALGATPADVQKMVFDSTLHVLLVGLLVGVLIASLSERVLENQIAQLMPNDISTWIVVPLAILAAGMLAGFVPARRAGRVDPNVVLREL